MIKANNNYFKKQPLALRKLSRFLCVALFCTPLALPWQAATASHQDCGENYSAFNPSIIQYDIDTNAAVSASYCELCGTGTISILITNPSTGNMDDFTVTHDFLASGLEYVPGSTRYRINGGGSIAGGNPASAGTQLTWTASDIPALSSIPRSPNHNYDTVEITFQVRSPSGNEEDLVNAIRNIQASADFTFCPGTTDEVNASVNTGIVQLPIREPEPSVVKRGRNIDAAQSGYSATVYGNINDDVIWRIRINNSGLADLQDLKFDDLMQNGNFQINYACPTQGGAVSVANNDGADPGGTNCVSASNTINDFVVDDPFGNPGNDEPGAFIDVPAGGRADIFLVGKITNSCNANTTNTVNNIEWGCEAVSPDGGITATSTGTGAGSSTSTLSSRVSNNGINIQREITGTNTSQPAGSKGTVTITITNNSGGSVKNIYLRDVLPSEYVVDPTFDPTISVDPAYGNYDGMIDTITWTNPVAGTYPAQTSTNETDYLANTAPEFDLTSSTSHPVHSDQFDMLRHGDVAVITFRVVLVPDTGYDPYDISANLDVTPENTISGTDPDNDTTITNQLYVTFEQFCTPGVTQQASSYPFTDNFPAEPEDLDIAIDGVAFILTNDTSQELTLPVQLTNNGGHDASDYHMFVSFGATMEVVSTPAGCSIANTPGGTPASPDEWQPPSWYVWIKEPAPDSIVIPSTATVYECTSPSSITPGQTVTYNFNVIKTSNAARIALDDLTFRADVVGEITLSDGTPLWYPAPVTRVDGELDRANNYSLDAVWARVIGFNLKKSQVGQCNENTPSTLDSNGFEEVQISEECTFRIETGGWFGFETPGFSYIAVQNIDVVDEVPDGQAYISSTDPYATSTALIGVNGDMTLPGIGALTEGWFNWSFNITDANRIEVADEWFIVDAVTRMLNKPVDSSASPNDHAANSPNVLNSTFDATFQNNNTGATEQYSLGPATIGYPNEPIRRVDLTVTEPEISVVKEVCNETLYGSGTGCSNFVTLTNEGDTQDSYIYRITMTNEASASGVTRAPAYDLVSTDTLDASDMMLVVDFASDGLDNDGDGLIDGNDTNGEGSISDNTVENGIPAVITYSYTHSDALLKIDAGSSVVFYYRVDPDDSIAPAQQLTNTVTASYDSLADDYGNQTVVQSANGTLGGARVYTTTPAVATVEILPLIAQPKTVLNLSNTTLTGSQPQAISIGEEIEYQLQASIPVANLRDFYIRDELPAGIRCVEAPVVDLDAPPYSDAGFFPGGQITPTCNDNLVYWYFGDQELTTAPDARSRFDFAVQFIARVENSTVTNDGVTISNGNPATSAFLHYQNDALVDVILDFSQHDLEVNEPTIVLTKTYETNTTDAGDIITVTVTAQNTGTATGYNLRILDDLVGTKLTYIANITGADPPDSIDITTFGANQPVFFWNSIAPGATYTFSFDISVDTAVQPYEVLDNTIQADWTSLPSQSTALNSTGSIGTSGSATGMRIGALPNAGDTLNDYEATATDSATVPAVTMTKTDLNPAVAAEIGLHKHFQIEIVLPEGTTNNLVANDNLQTGTQSYLLANNADYDVTYTFQGIATINGQPPTEAVFNAYPADAATGNVIWDIGTVVTDTEDDTVVTSVNPVIRIDYYARINNDIDTNDGDTLQNSVDVTFTNGETGAAQTLNDNTALITAVEPLLTVTKTVTPTTPVTPGDILEYTLTIVNTGSGTAHDINIVDTLPAELELYSTFTPTAEINGTPVTGFVANPANAPNGPLVWGRNNSDNSLDLPAGDTLVLVYQAQLPATVQAGASFNNSVVVDWTSLDGDSSYERNGTGCPVITAPDDYCAGPVTVTSTTTDTNNLSKTIIGDTYTDAPSTAIDSIARVGDLVTYRLALNLQEGLTRSVTVQDILPAGLAFYDIVAINTDNSADYDPPAAGAGSNFQYATLTAGNVPAAGATGTLTFTFGDITNDPLGDSTTDTLVIEYRAQVQTDVLGHTPSTTLTNTATLYYVDAGGTPVVNPGRLESSATLTIWQPVIGGITKIDRSGRTSTATVNVATDTMNFRIEACNTTGSAPAYSVLISDDLATQFDEASIAGPNNGAGQPDVYINGVLATPVTDYTYTPPALRGGNMTFRLISPVDPAECVQIDYDIGFHTDFGSSQTWSNNATLDEYWSLPLNNGQQYGPLGPVIFSMTNGVVTFDPPTKVVNTPAGTEVTIGEDVIYYISVPGNVPNAALYDVVVTDTLHPALEYVSATDVSGNNIPITDNTSGNNVSLAIPHIPAGQQAVIALHTRVANNAQANAGVTFNNTANYTYAVTTDGATINGGDGTTAGSLTIVEPLLTVNKAVTNVTSPGNPPIAGDMLRYTLTFPASGGTGGDNFSNAYDLSIVDSLSPGLAYQNGSATVDGSGNTIVDPTITGDGVTTAQTLDWNLADATAEITVAEGTTVTVTYDVLVLDGVRANQDLVNSASVQWTGIDGDSLYERNGSGTPAINDYFAGPATTTLTTSDNTAITKTRITDTYGAPDANVRIGDIIEYEIRLTLNEGTTPNALVTDTLPQGLAYEHMVSVNGDATVPFSAVPPFSHAELNAPLVSGDPATGPSTLTWHIGDIVNSPDGNPANDEFVLVYRARVLDNVFTQTATTVLVNNATLQYDTAVGTTTISNNAPVTLIQPILSVAKSAVTVGGDTILDAGELVTYTVAITNNGDAPAYDPLVLDTIPRGMRNGTATITMVSTTLAGLAVTNVVPAYDPVTGVASWNFDNGIADAYTIAPGETLSIEYQVQAEATLAPGLTLTNQALVQHYYSFDNDDAPSLGGITGTAEIYGPSNIAAVTLTTAPPAALDKQNTVASATIGEQFSYRIIVPATPLTTALHDVRIIDDLSVSAADLSYVSVTKISGSQPWTPENTGSDTNIIIEDTIDGIDIPAGDQIEIEITVQVMDTAGNIGGLTFNNTASYTFNQYNGDATTQANGVADTTSDMTIVEPDVLTLEKSGPDNMRVGLPGTFTLNVHNTGSSPAYDVTITDLIPNPDPGGMCDMAPYNISAQLYVADLSATVGAPLVENTDYAVSFVAGTPSCTLTLTMLTPAAAIPANHRLIINYDANIDADSPYNDSLTNVAGVTQWYSLDTDGSGATGQIRTYTKTFDAANPGTVGTLDDEDAHTVVTETPTIEFHKYVVNITTGQDPGVNATPGDTLRYRIVATNVSDVAVPNFSVTDEIDNLNSTPLFVPGSLTIINVPADADITNTNPNAGTNGTGILDVRNLHLDAQGGADNSITIEFDVTLAAVIDSGTYVLNQAQLHNYNLPAQLSDDPNVNGVDDGDPTQTLIASAPQFQVYKSSTDISGSPTQLMPGETLRYTLTVKNIGTENAVNTLLQDTIPDNTTYISGTTTLNGEPVPDPASGVSAIEGGMLVNAPQNTTPGYMPADAGATTDNVATITFDVRINTDVINGTIISNQGYINADGAGDSGAIAQQPSDDPDTAVPDDPTRDVVGNLPLVDALKTVAIQVDNGTPGIVDPGDTLRYTITVTNYGGVEASGVTLTDEIPRNTTYVPGTLYLNGLPLTDPTTTITPVTIDIPISSSDRTPPAPEVGYLSPGQSAVVTFDVMVDATTPLGTVISNQGFVDNNELPLEPTDADGLDSNGDQPTLIAVGNAQQLSITKAVSVVGGGPALAGGQLEYVVRVTNVGTVPAYDVEIIDDLDTPVPDQMTYVPGTATLNGLPDGIVYLAPTFTVDYAGTYGLLQPGEVAELRFRVLLNSNLALGETVTNIAQVHWNNMTQMQTATVSIDIGAMPGVANLNGRVWHDANFDDVFDSGGERTLENWNVDIYFKGNLLDTVTTDANGEYHINGLAPNYNSTDRYELRFVAPGAGPNTAKLGQATSSFTNALQHIYDIVVYPGNNLLDLNLPIDPNGVVYNSIVRVPVPGATLTMINASTNTPLPASCFDDPAQQNQVTLVDGYYKFDINFLEPECNNGDDYLITVTPPASGFVTGESVAIPPLTNASTAAFNVPNCAGGANDAVPATANHCEVQTFATLPPLSIAPRTDGTRYHLHLTLDNVQVPGDSQLFNNHIPLDPDLGQAVTISKTSSMVNVSRGELVPYTITVNNTLPVSLTDVSIIDDLPAGFKYVQDSARVNGEAAEPVINNRQISWDVNEIDVDATYTIEFLLIVGSGVSEGEYINRAHVRSNLTATNVSGEASAAVRVVPDAMFDCSDVVGKVFDDRNLNGYQDDDEPGIGGVRLATARGLLVTTDKHGRFHVTCALVPNEDRGSNFILKLDERTLPSGYRVTTENPRVQRVTRGKMSRFNFGATVHHVVTLSVADGVFRSDSEQLRPQWSPRLDLLIEELLNKPSVLRVTYLADVETADLVDDRLDELKQRILEKWRDASSQDLNIETEVYWRHGGPVDNDLFSSDNLGTGDYVSSVFDRSTFGDNSEKHLPHDYTFTPWTDSTEYQVDNEPRIETRHVTEKDYTTRKLKNVVPPILFKSGKAEIPDEYVTKLREVLDRMRDRINVRLHFIGHTDNVKLQGDLKQQYENNMGLSKERAGTTAEFFKRALELSPDAISYEGLGETQPVASNDTAAGRATNRRVEVQVWYDEVHETKVEKQVQVTPKTRRIMVCRVETLCKLRFKEGHSYRAKLKNLVPPFHYDEGISKIPAQYLQKLQQALRNLSGKENVQMRFIGYTDNIPLTGRDARIYGNHVGLSRANARRVAIAVQEALGLPDSAIYSNGKGSTAPIASNNSPKGRALNRRIEVEFWHDDPLEDLPDEPQICPEAAGAETVERIYNPPEGDIPPVYFENGQPVIPRGIDRRLRRAMNDIKDEANVRIRFIGYTSNKRLSRRTAMVYGDDIGLSTARARRAMEIMKQQMNLSDAQVEFEGRGYVQSHDVVNTGFVELDRSKVEVQVVYDELALLDNMDGVSINRISRSVVTRNPYALNLMRIAVDGQPLNDPNKNIPDVQRCTDVALDQARVRFKFDNMQLKPRLNVTAWPNVIAHADDVNTQFVENRTHFKLYTNYPSFIDKAEVRLFTAEQSSRDTPLAVVPLDGSGKAQWQYQADNYSAPRVKLKYLVRVYDKQGNFDETAEQTLWVVDVLDADNSDKTAEKQLLTGYGENRLALNNIPLHGGTVRVYGKNVPQGHKVWFAGHELPVTGQVSSGVISSDSTNTGTENSEDVHKSNSDSSTITNNANGQFGGEFILPSGLHTVEVAITDENGNGNVYQRDLELQNRDWFYVGIADLTASRNNTNGPAELVTQDEEHYSDELSIDGRLAFYTKGKFANDVVLTASADTREGPVDELFSNFMNKSPEALFRRIDPDYYYPTFGDDSTVEEDAPTSGKLYMKLQKDDNYGMWGNFDIAYLDNNLAHVDRGLYGANMNYETQGATSFGEKRFASNLFAAEPGTIAGRDEFRGTGGSLYYLRRQDILTGSERLRIEVRDSVSGLVVGVKNLIHGLDYDIDYIQGRIMLSQPLSSSVDSNTLIDSSDYGGNDAYLVARYEYTPGFTDLDDVVKGGRVHYWLNDQVKLGATAQDQDVTGEQTSLNAYDLTYRYSAGTWLKLEQSTSEGPVASTLSSSDGGYSFNEYALVPGTLIEARGQRVDASVRLQDIFTGLNGTVTFFNQQLDAGYAAPGLIALTDTTQTGVTMQLPVMESVNIKLKADQREQENALESEAAEVNVDYLMTEHWTFGAGLRHDKRIDHSPAVPLTQQQGERSDLAVKATYDSRANWLAYGYIQDTTHVSGNRDENGRIGVGGDYRVTDRFKFNGEVSDGDLGNALKLGTQYKMSDATDLYSSYVLENERTDNGVKARQGNMTSGFKTRYADSASIYVEERYTHGDIPTGLTHAMGFDLSVTDHLNLGGNLDVGNLRDNYTGAETRRKALGFKLGYKFDALTYAGAMEYRVDETEQPDTTFAERKTWLLKNSLKYQLTADWRVIAKLNHSESESSLGEFYNGNFTEAVVGYAFRPVNHDALNALFKYTYFYNLPAAEQVTLNTTSNYIQKSHILSLDVTYDVTAHWTLGGKYAHRIGELALDREDPQFFDNEASLYILRADWHFTHSWDALLEGRLLDIPDAGDSRSGLLFAIYHHFGTHIKGGIGYNFTDFSDDLTDLDYDSRGMFINVIGKF